jgi:hypothetical protein
MQFQAKTEKQINEENLIPEGVYPFDVMNADNKTSKAGNEMIELELRIYCADGRERSLNDWLMPKMAFKLFHFCAYCGLSQQYDAGTLTAADCVGKSGFVKIGIQADKQGQYPDRNSVKDYVRPEPKLGSAKIAPAPLTEKQIGNVTEGPAEDVPF